MIQLRGRSTVATIGDYDGDILAIGDGDMESGVDSLLWCAEPDAGGDADARAQDSCLRPPVRGRRRSDYPCQSRRAAPPAGGEGN